MLRTHHCGELRIENVNQTVTLSGWVQASRDFGGLTFIDLRDRYGITQLVFNMEDRPELCQAARKLGREYVILCSGLVRERSNKNPNRSTGDIEIVAERLDVLNSSKVPPFTIENESDGGDELRMKFRYLDIRRNPVKEKLLFRSNLALETRKYLNNLQFVEIETPCLIKSTPEGARDFVVPSRMNPGQFYALPQSPQTFKQILMVAGIDRYFQIVKCFRDEDLRADRQPEFTQIDCEMSFVTQEDIISTFEGLTKYLFTTLLNVDLPHFPIMTYDEAIHRYGSDKPDTRFGMLITDLSDGAKGKDFQVFNQAEYIGAICAKNQASSYSNKQLNELTDWVKRPQIGAKGLVYVKWNEDGSFKSSVGKFYDDQDFQKWFQLQGGEKGDLLLILSGKKESTLKQLGELRLEIGRRMNLMDPNSFSPLWVVDFPLLEWSEEDERFHARHHPFTSPIERDRDKMKETNHGVLASIKGKCLRFGHEWC